MHLILDINQRTIIELYLNINYNILILYTHNREPPLRRLILAGANLACCDFGLRILEHGDGGSQFYTLSLVVSHNESSHKITFLVSCKE